MGQTFDLDRVRDLRPRITSPDGHLLGEQRLQQALDAHLADPSGYSVMLVHGGPGTGRSAALRWLATRTQDGVEDLRQVMLHCGALGDPAGEDLVRLRAELEATPRPAGAILVFDDVDASLNTRGIRRLVGQIMKSLERPRLVLTSAAPLSGELAVPLREHVVGARRSTADEFRGYLHVVLAEHGHAPDIITDRATEALHALEGATTDFRAFLYFLEMLVGIHRQQRTAVSLTEIFHLLRNDDGIQAFPTFPTVHAPNGARTLAFRRKEKAEVLTELLIRAVGSAEDFALIAESRLEGFDGNRFRTRAAASYWDAVMGLCLTRSPLELVERLVGPKDVRRELERLNVEQSLVVADDDEPARRLVRAIGFTLTGPPIGLPQHVARLEEIAIELATAEELRSDHLQGIGLNLTRTVERFARDMLQFFGWYLNGSVGATVDAHNRRNAAGHSLRLDRLTLGDIVALLEQLDAPSDEVAASFAVSLLGRERLIGAQVIEALQRFTGLRNVLVHGADVGSRTSLAAQVRELHALALELFNAARPVFPVVVKVREVVFDEYSRMSFTATDSSGQPVQIALSEVEELTRIEVSRHYFLWPPGRVVVNPVLVPTSGPDSSALFTDGDAYDVSSSTQHRQGTSLVELAALRPDDRVLDVGCGNGTLSLELSRLALHGSVLGIDVSPEMVRTARRTASTAGAGNLNFEVRDLLEFRTDEPYTLVFANSTMHWILPPESAYRRLFDALAPGGRLAVNQGGHRCYEGLWGAAFSAIRTLGLDHAFVNWRYPAWYPRPEELTAVLERAGFVDVEVRSVESDGSEHPLLVEDFSQAGLLPFLRQVPERQRERLRNEYLRLARAPHVSTYTHRLYATAVRP